MAYYTYYNSQPAWGTQQYQYVAPPVPQYQPQPSWGGVDYYRAHSNGADNTVFDYVWFKLRDLVIGAGVGRNEASHWWKKVYGGLVSPSMLLPRELGAAAGYEAIRCWEQHRSIYAQPLSQDRGREREALIGLAAAEAAKLWAYTQRPLDKYGRLEASEVAASTASSIFTQSYNRDSPYEAYDKFPKTRRRSISGTRYGSGDLRNNYLDDDVDIPDFSFDHPHASPRRSFSSYRRPRHRSTSSMGYNDGVISSVGLSSSAVAYPVTQYVSGSSPYSAASFGAGIPGVYYPGAAYPQISSGYSYGGATLPYMNNPYAGSSVGLPPPPAATGQYLTVPGAAHRRSHSWGAYGATRPSFGY